MSFHVVPYGGGMAATPHVRTEVRPGPDGPVIVRVALDDAGREALRREADRLRRCRHPGVVELRAEENDELTLAWAGSETLATARPDPVRATAVLAAVAGTVADLHGLGIVHGRIEPSHVVVGPDGHPRLCGLRGPDPGAPHPEPSDDVAALGALVDHLVGPGIEVEPIPDRRWGRRVSTGFQRRALQTLADRAGAADPADRPTARELARAIVQTVPEDRPDRAPVLRVVAAAAIVAGVLAAATWLRPSSGRSTAPRAEIAVAPPPSSEPAPVACTTTADDTAMDLDGDGCPDPFRVDGTSVRALGRTFEVGRSGDHVQVGDWDCDGRATVAVVRATTGEVFVFDTWERSGEAVTVNAVDVVEGARSLQVDPGPSCTPVVRGDDGTDTPLDLGAVAP